MVKTEIVIVAILCVSLTHGQDSLTFESSFPEADTPNEEKIEIPNDAFDWSLFATTISLMPNDTQNVLISPFSLKFAMAMFYEVTSGNTREQIESVLQFPSTPQENRRKFLKFLESLKEKSNDYVLNFASRIYLDDSIRPRQKTGAIFNNIYHAEVKSMNVNEVAKSASDANAWFEKITDGKIKNLVFEEDFQDTFIVMLNAIFFEGTWENQFSLTETKIHIFYVTPEKIISSPFISQTDNFLFYKSQNLDSKILRLPYKGNKYAMYIILPNTINGLSKLIKTISASQIQRDLQSANSTIVDVKLPKFKIEYLSKFIPILKEMNIRDLFDSSASLPGLARGLSLNKKLVVSNIVQKLGINVNEFGSTYSATEGTIEKIFKTNNNEEFFADRPFLFFIQEETSKEILFMGKIENPILSGESEKKPENTLPRFPQTASVSPTASASYRPQAPSGPTSNKVECGYVYDYVDITPLSLNSEIVTKVSPWHIGVYKKQNDGIHTFTCGGTIVSNNIAITAAHCFHSDTEGTIQSPSGFAIAIGKLFQSWDTFETDSQKSNIREIITSEKYGGFELNLQHDIAILVLESRLNFSNTIYPVCLDLHDINFKNLQITPGSLGTVVGWGLTEAGNRNSASEELRFVKIPVVDYKTCKSKSSRPFRRYLLEDKICAGYLNGTTLCNGDSGGGFIVPNDSSGTARYYLRAIVSISEIDQTRSTCKHIAYAGLTNIWNHRQLIIDAMEKYR